MLEVHNFAIYTNHKPLIYVFRQKSDKLSPRQLRHLDFISQFTTDFRHVTDSNNSVVDTSGIKIIHMPEPLDYK